MSVLSEAARRAEQKKSFDPGPGNPVLDLIWRPQPDAWTDRALVVGGVGTGKSTLGETLAKRAVNRYPNLHLLIVDSKPRFRGEWETNGLSAERRYAQWDHGTPWPDSVVLPYTNMAASLNDVWKHGKRVAIAQTRNGPESLKDIAELQKAVSVFLTQSRAYVPHLVLVDEVMDFYTVTGHAINGDTAILRCWRAGRERGMAGIACTQRPRGVPTQLPQESNRLYLFQLRNADDTARLDDFGTPDDLAQNMPRKRHVFYFYDHEAPEHAGMYRLTIGEKK